MQVKPHVPILLGLYNYLLEVRVVWRVNSIKIQIIKTKPCNVGKGKIKMETIKKTYQQYKIEAKDKLQKALLDFEKSTGCMVNNCEINIEEALIRRYLQKKGQRTTIGNIDIKTDIDIG